MSNIRVVNMSLGMPAHDSYKVYPLCQATERLYDARFVTIVTTGNYGRAPDGSPSAPTPHTLLPALSTSNWKPRRP